MKRFFGAACICGILLAGCAQPPAIDRSGRLLTMTSEEAANISSTLERFTRQLNIADTQVQTGRKADADKSLLLARDTLVSSKDATFDSFHRIAGWTAIAQLARAAEDRPLALKASDEALAALNNVSPVPERAQYVLSLAGELYLLKGRIDAIELLNSGAGWAEKIDDVNMRREALIAFSYRLISYDAFDDVRTALRRDPDAVWRTDTLLAMSHYYAGDYAWERDHMRRSDDLASVTSGSTAGAGRAGGISNAEDAYADRQATKAPRSGPPSFGKDVRFESVYKR